MIVHCVVHCVVCGKQAISDLTDPKDRLVTTLIGAVTAMHPDECYCGHCAKDLDDNGMFPEEAASCKRL